MEGVHNNQPEGARNDITSHDEPIVYEAPAPNHPPVTFTEAVGHSPHALLRELSEHVLSVHLDEQQRNQPRHHLAELALSSAVVWWWSHWQPIMIHRALSTGASLAEVAAAAGIPEPEAYDQWSRWAEQQSQIMIGDRPAVDPAEADAVREQIRRTSSADVLARQEHPAG